MDENIEKVPVDLTPEPPKVEEQSKDIEIFVADDAIGDENSEKDPQKAIEKLKKKLKKEKEARRDAEEKARLAAFQAQRASVEVEDTQMHLVANAIETVKRDNEILTANYAEAMRNGDYETGARIQIAMNQNEANLKQLEDGHIRMQNEARTKPPVPQEPPQVLKPKQQVDQIITQVSKPSAQWLKTHRDHFDSESKIRKMFNAHQEAVDDGIKPDSTEYFRYIENRLNINTDDPGESPMSSASKPSSRQAPPPSAPVNRDGGRKNVGWLTPAQAEAAKSMGMTDKEYYNNLMALQKEGRLTH